MVSSFLLLRFYLFLINLLTQTYNVTYYTVPTVTLFININYMALIQLLLLLLLLYFVLHFKFELFAVVIFILVIKIVINST
jgi:hypothetical protein